MKTKRMLMAVLALILCIAMIAGCTPATQDGGGTAATPAPPAASTDDPADDTGDDPASDMEILPMRYIMPGGPSLETDAVNVAINEKLAADGVPVDFQPDYVPWDAWVDRTNLMLSVGEEFELLHIMMDWMPLTVYSARDVILPLDDLINEYAPGLWNLFEDVFWQSASVGGRTMGIPAQWRDNSGDTEGALMVRIDKLDEFGLTVPSSFDEIVETMTTLQQEWAALDGMNRYIWEHSLSRPPVAFHRAYPTWPFYVSDGGMFMVRQDGQAELYFTTEEFRQDADFMRRLFEAGLIHPDILNIPHEQIVDLRENGDMLLAIQTPLARAPGMARRGIEGESYQYWLNDGGAFLMNTPMMNCNAVPHTTNNPQAALMFLYWMYSQQENQELVLYGIQGDHWSPVGDQDRDIVRNDEGTPMYMFDYWMIQHIRFHRFITDDESTEFQRADHLGNVREAQTVMSPVIGFLFSPDDVSVEYSNVLAEYTASILPIKLGVIPYEQNIERALENMRAAGMDRLLEEYQRQLAAHLADN